jgi:transposase
MEKKLPETIKVLNCGWQKKQPLRLMFQDEARFGRISTSKACWCPSPYRPVCRTMVCHDYVYAYGAVSLPDGQWDSLLLPRVDTICMQVFLDEISLRYPENNIIMVVDGAGWHKSKLLKLHSNMKMLPLPAYSPELNPVENIWDELREKFFSNRVFDNHDALEQQLLTGLRQLELNKETTRSIAAWPWIITDIRIEK